MLFEFQHSHHDHDMNSYNRYVHHGILHHNGHLLFGKDFHFLSDFSFIPFWRHVFGAITLYFSTGPNYYSPPQSGDHSNPIPVDVINNNHDR